MIFFSIKNKQDIAFNWSDWRFLRNTAKAFGWEPLGTVINPEASMIVWEEDNLSEIEWQRIKKGMERVGEIWKGNYDSNDTQTVTDQDAANLLQALTRAINDQDFLESIDEDALAGGWGKLVPKVIFKDLDDEMVILRVNGVAGKSAPAPAKDTHPHHRQGRA